MPLSHLYIFQVEFHPMLSSTEIQTCIAFSLPLIQPDGKMLYRKIWLKIGCPLSNNEQIGFNCNNSPTNITWIPPKSKLFSEIMWCNMLTSSKIRALDIDISSQIKMPVFLMQSTMLFLSNVWSPYWECTVFATPLWFAGYSTWADNIAVSSLEWHPLHYPSYKHGITYTSFSNYTNVMPTFCKPNNWLRHTAAEFQSWRIDIWIYSQFMKMVGSKWDQSVLQMTTTY